MGIVATDAALAYLLRGQTGDVVTVHFGPFYYAGTRWALELYLKAIGSVLGWLALVGADELKERSVKRTIASVRTQYLDQAREEWLAMVSARWQIPSLPTTALAPSGVLNAASTSWRRA